MPKRTVDPENPQSPADPPGEMTPAERQRPAEPEESTDELVAEVYDALRALADRFMSAERTDHSLQATALVHELYLKLAPQARARWQNRSHFLAVAARAMRRLLINHARERSRLKRGGDRVRIGDDPSALPEGAELDLDSLIDLDGALTRLAGLHPRQASIAELRYFSGMTIAEIADHLGVSGRTVEGDWAVARAWLRRELFGARG